MLNEVMRICRNFFDAEHLEGSFSIKGGTISLPFVSRYVLIEGSKFNNGIQEYPLTDLKDEDFNGAITAVNPPDDFIDLVNDIKKYVNENKPTPYVSESFGGYSYTKATVNGKIPGWQEVFADRLKIWRKL